MRDRARGWGTVGGGLLLTAAGHGWVLLAGVAAILGLTYLAAYVLLHKLKGCKVEGATIITPFLVIKTGPDDHNVAVDSDGVGIIAEPIELVKDDGGVVARTTQKRSVGKQAHGKQTTRLSEHATGQDRYKPSLLTRKMPITLPWMNTLSGSSVWIG